LLKLADQYQGANDDESDGGGALNPDQRQIFAEYASDRDADGRYASQGDRRSDENRPRASSLRRQSHSRQLGFVSQLGQKDHAECRQYHTPIHLFSPALKAA
jgi:hypothetical protein